MWWGTFLTSRKCRTLSELCKYTYNNFAHTSMNNLLLLWKWVLIFLQIFSDRNQKIYPDILNAIGNTPLVKLSKIPKQEGLKCDMCEYYLIISLNSCVNANFINPYFLIVFPTNHNLKIFYLFAEYYRVGTIIIFNIFVIRCKMWVLKPWRIRKGPHCLPDGNWCWTERYTEAWQVCYCRAYIWQYGHRAGPRFCCQR